MATAQQLFVDQFVSLINSNANLNKEMIASSPSAGVLRVTAIATGPKPQLLYEAGRSTDGGGGSFLPVAARGTPERADLRFSWTLKPGDRVVINASIIGGVALDVQYDMPAGTSVDPGGFDHLTASLGGSGTTVGGTGTATARDRRLVVMECGLGSASLGSLFAIDPNNAVGISIPTFRVGAAMPVVGSTIGESFYDTGTSKGAVWDGAAWKDIAPSPVQNYPTEAALMGDSTPAPGTYAVAQDTGDLFVKTSAGWRLAVVKSYTSHAALVMDLPNRQAGEIGIDVGEGVVFVRTTAGWKAQGPRSFATMALLTAWAEALPGDVGEDSARSLMYMRTSAAAGTAGAWRPMSLYEDTEANIRAATGWPVVGQEAISTDTGRNFAYTSAGWVEEPINHFATEALLLAATPPDGTLAWADDSSNAFTRAGGAWNRLGGGVSSTVAPTAPTGPSRGDLWLDQTTHVETLKVFTGTIWKNCNGSTVNEIGARTLIPGYPTQPTATATPTLSTTGVALRAEGSKQQLWGVNGDAWLPMTPWIGDPSHQGQVATCDGSGFVTWATPKKAINVAKMTATGQSSVLHHFVIGAFPQLFFRIEASVQTSQNCGLYFIAQRDSSWIDWSACQQGYSLTQYISGGLQSPNLMADPAWNTTTAGLGLSNQNDGDYQIKSAMYCGLTLHGQFHDNGLLTLKSQMTYISANQTPMVADAFITGPALVLTGHLSILGLKVSAGTMNVTSTLEWE